MWYETCICSEAPQSVRDTNMVRGHTRAATNAPLVFVHNIVINAANEGNVR